MFDHDEMKSGLLQDLIESLLSMKEGKPGEGDHQDPSQAAIDPDHDGDDDSAEMPGADDPKAKVSILDIKAKPGMMGGDMEKPEDDQDDAADMHAPVDFAALKRKHMGL